MCGKRFNHFLPVQLICANLAKYIVIYAWATWLRNKSYSQMHVGNCGSNSKLIGRLTMSSNISRRSRYFEDLATAKHAKFVYFHSYSRFTHTINVVWIPTSLRSACTIRRFPQYTLSFHVGIYCLAHSQRSHCLFKTFFFHRNFDCSATGVFRYTAWLLLNISSPWTQILYSSKNDNVESK